MVGGWWLVVGGCLVAAQGDASFTLQVRTDGESKVEAGSGSGSGGGGGGGGGGDATMKVDNAATAPKAVSADAEVCPNCGDEVPRARIVMHTAFCERHNVKCGVAGCGAVVHKSESEKHWHWYVRRARACVCVCVCVCMCVCACVLCTLSTGLCGCSLRWLLLATGWVACWGGVCGASNHAWVWVWFGDWAPAVVLGVSDSDSCCTSTHTNAPHTHPPTPTPTPTHTAPSAPS